MHSYNLKLVKHYFHPLTKTHMSRQEEHELTHATQITVSFRSTQGIKNYLSQPKKRKKERSVQTFNLLLTQVIPLNHISLNNRSIMCFQ